MAAPRQLDEWLEWMEINMDAEVILSPFNETKAWLNTTLTLLKVGISFWLPILKIWLLFLLTLYLE